MKNLHEIHSSTDFVVGSIVLNVGKRNADFDIFLWKHGAKNWSIVTWCNPDSLPVSNILNEKLNFDLQSTLAMQYEIHPAIGKGIDGWGSEVSWLILNISRHEANSLAATGHQTAYIYGEIGCAPELILTKNSVQVF